MSLRVGELFAGYGGLFLALQQVLDVELTWVSEYEPPSKANPKPSQAAAKILAHHYPYVPNHGNITSINWSHIEPVDVLTGGSPCQDLSAAGKRVGMKAGTRSGLWVSMVTAVKQLRPSLVIWENVRGALSAEADSTVEPCSGCVGDGSATALRALGRVLGDLAELGYDARWCGLRAADVGAPHGRFRVFVVAWPADTKSYSWGLGDGDDAGGRGGASVADAQHGGRDGRSPAPVGGEVGGTTAAGSGKDAAADPDGDTVREQPVTKRRGSSEAEPGQPRADAVTDAQGDGRREGWPESTRLKRGPDAAECGAVAPDAQGERWPGHEQPWSDMEQDGPEPAHARTSGGVAWGAYEPAIRRWEHILGRVAPPPTEPGRTGNPRLSPWFVEWMMGLPDGWVTDVPGISRNDMLKALGNGVVPQQASAALQRLLTHDQLERAA